MKEYFDMLFPSEKVLSTMQDRLTMEELNFDREALSNELSGYMQIITDEQKRAYDEIIEAVKGNKGGLFFLYEYSGTGKTFLWKTFSASI